MYHENTTSYKKQINRKSKKVCKFSKTVVHQTPRAIVRRDCSIMRIMHGFSQIPRVFLSTHAPHVIRDRELLLLQGGVWANRRPGRINRRLFAIKLPAVLHALFIARAYPLFAIWQAAHCRRGVYCPGFFFYECVGPVCWLRSDLVLRGEILSLVLTLKCREWLMCS